MLWALEPEAKRQAGEANVRPGHIYWGLSPVPLAPAEKTLHRVNRNEDRPFCSLLYARTLGLLPFPDRQSQEQRGVADFPGPDHCGGFRGGPHAHCTAHEGDDREQGVLADSCLHSAVPNSQIHARSGRGRLHRILGAERTVPDRAGPHLRSIGEARKQGRGN